VERHKINLKKEEEGSLDRGRGKIVRLPLRPLRCSCKGGVEVGMIKVEW
jgi:hypothetical protein